MKRHIPLIIFLIIAGTIVYALLTIEGYKYFTKEQENEPSSPLLLRRS